MNTFLLVVCLASQVMAASPVSQSVYNDIIYFAQLSAAAALGDPCSTPPYGIIVQEQIDTGHDIGQLGVEATLFRNDTTHHFVLAFAASNNTANYIEDMDTTLVPVNRNFPCTGCKVHQGFQTAYGRNNYTGTIAQLVRSALKKAFGQYPAYSLAIAGASLGGALASLSYADLVQIYNNNITSVYTYGEPRVGNIAYANYIDSHSGASDTVDQPGLYFRVTHANDIVPKLPPQGLEGLDQYRHSRTEYWESLTDGDNNTYATVYRCYGQEDPTCNFGSTGASVSAHETYAGYAAVHC